MPWLGIRWAELFEMPFMLIVIILSARWIVKRTKGQTPDDLMSYFGMGIIALVCLLVAEIGVGVGLRGMMIY